LTGGAPVELSGEDIAALCEEDWPGNVRELENVTKRWLALRKRDLKSLIGGSHSTVPIARSNPSLPAKANDAYDPEPELILRTLEKYQWHRQKAAQALNMSYQALRRRIIKYKLDQAR